MTGTPGTSARTSPRRIAPSIPSVTNGHPGAGLDQGHRGPLGVLLAGHHRSLGFVEADQQGPGDAGVGGKPPRPRGIATGCTPQVGIEDHVAALLHGELPGRASSTSRSSNPTRVFELMNSAAESRTAASSRSDRAPTTVAICSP